MAELSAAEQKVLDYLSEAHANERRLEAVLGEHAETAQPTTYRRRLQKHAKETHAHAQALERRIEQLGGSTNGGLAARAPEAVQTAQSVARRAASLAQAGLDTVRGTSERERAVKTARAEYAEEASEIALYTALQALAEAVNDRDTSKLARSIRREEERMAQYLSDLIPELVRASVEDEVAPPQPKPQSRPRQSRTTATKSSGAGTAKRSAGSAKTSASSSAKRSASSSAKRSASSSAKRSPTSAKRSASSSAKRSATSAKRSASSSAKRSARQQREEESHQHEEECQQHDEGCQQREEKTCGLDEKHVDRRREFLQAKPKVITPSLAGVRRCRSGYRSDRANSHHDR